MRTLALFTILTACGDSPPPSPDAPPATCITTGGASCFQLPTAPLGVSSGTLQLACAPMPPTQSTMAITMSGQTTDFTTQGTLAGTTIDVFYASDLATPAATATSDPTGAYSLTLPAPVPSIIYTRARHATEYDMLQYASAIDVSGGPLANANVQLLSPGANAAIETELGISDPPGSAYEVIFPTDCSGQALANAIATVSSTSSAGNVAPTFVPGTMAFYLDGNVIPQPRSTLTATGGGGFVIYGGVPGQTYYVQTWGFLDPAGVAQGMAGLRLVSEVAIASVGQTVLVSTIRANQSPH